jgi:alanyl aminopeptidase
MLRLVQSRFLPQGVNAPASPLWLVPITVRTPAGTVRTMLTEKNADVALPGDACPPWVQANVNGSGYYRTVYAPGGLSTVMAQADLGMNELLANLNDAVALTESGDLSVAEALALATRFAAHPRREVVDAALGIIVRMDRLLEPSERPAYAGLWQTAYGARARQLGLIDKPGESFEDRLSRTAWVERVADAGQDVQLRGQATRLTQLWLQDRKAIPSANRSLILRTAALSGDRALFDALQAAVLGNTDRRARADIYAALGNFRSPDLALSARQLMLDPRHDIREVMASNRSRGATEAVRDETFAFYTTHFDAIAARLPADAPARFPQIFSGFCTAEHATQVDQFFRPLVSRYEGIAKSLAQSLESIRLCSAYRQHQHASLQSVLKAY